MTGPEKATGPDRANDQPRQDHTKTEALIVAPRCDTGKQYATLRARCALAGVVLHQIENDFGKTVYIVSRWALTRELSDLESVAAWLDCVTWVQQ